MTKCCCVLLTILSFASAEASWYWPFGEREKDPPRLSELVEKASTLIGEGSDLASDGKVTEAVAKYRAALVELDRVERENADRAKTPEFSTLKTKRAYVEATIDSLLLNQARANARSVAVSDTTELEKRFANEQRAKKRERAMKAISKGDFLTAKAVITLLLREKPNDAAALNLRAAMESAQGDYRAAERTLDAAIRSNPRDYFAYYNMAELKLRSRTDDKDGARRYYETGRTYGGPKDAELEELLK